MIGHLGSRVSALLDGQLPPDEAERAWAHVHSCHFCRDQVEREGWVKTRLAGLSFGSANAPAHLKGSLRGGPVSLPPGDAYLALARHVDQRPRRNAGLVALGGGALGAAVMGVPGPRRRARGRPVDGPAGAGHQPRAPDRDRRDRHAERAADAHAGDQPDACGAHPLTR